MGPPPNNCIHRVHCSLLAPKEDVRIFTIGLVLAFDLAGASSRVERARALLAGEGFSDLAAARGRFPVPEGRWLCRPCLDGIVHDNTPEKEMGIVGGFVFTKDDGHRPSGLHPLQTALILGLCGPAYYAPDRPSVWSEARLGRRLVLYRADGYYE